MDYKQQDLGDFVGDVLALLEKTGGKHAFQHIKHTVPLCKPRNNDAFFIHCDSVY